MKKNEIIKIIEILKQTYPEATCSLNFTNSFELLVSVILSAQCTDERVNKTTPTLFTNYPTAKEIANMDLAVLEEYIHPCGFFKNKAKNIKQTAHIIEEVFFGEVPSTMEQLMSLPGVGRKTANVMMLEAFHMPQGIAVDTHCRRVSNRLGLSSQTDPEKIEQDLLKLIPKKYYKDVNHLFIWLGRYCCIARNPMCSTCSLKEYCPSFQN